MVNIVKVESPEQIAEVARLAQEIWNEHYIPIVGQDQVDYMLRKFQCKQAISEQIAASYEYFIINCDGKSVGYTAVIPGTDNSSMMLSKIYVKRSHRGNRLGSKMLEFVERLCLERNICTVWLTVNKHNSNSIEWYERMGFRNAGPTTLDIGEGFVMDDFRMEKILCEKENIESHD